MARLDTNYHGDRNNLSKPGKIVRFLVRYENGYRLCYNLDTCKLYKNELHKSVEISKEYRPWQSVEEPEDLP